MTDSIVDKLIEDGLLDEQHLADCPEFPQENVDFGAVIPWKRNVLRIASDNFHDRASDEDRNAFDAFCAEHAYWLDDFALFIAKL